MTPWDVTGERQILGQFRKWEGQNQEKRSETVIEVRDETGPGGESLVRVEMRIDKPTSHPVVKTVFWFQPKLDFAVWKMGQYNSKGQVHSRHDRCAYEIVGGKVYPKSAMMTVFHTSEDGEKTTVTWRNELQVDSIDVDPEHIPDSLFRLEIPKDTPVYDMDTKIRLVDQRALQEHLDRLSAEAPGRQQKRWWPAVVTLSVLALVLLTLGYWWAKRRNERPSI